MVDESCHNLLQYFDRFTTRDLLSKQSTVEATKEMCRYLGIDYNDLVKRCDNYNKAKARRNQKKMDEYKGWIYEIVSRTGFEAPSLKYIYYGTE
jgi:type I site-specific restriction-modification system R (restriction) subunit